DLLLAVDGDRATARELGERNAVRPTVETQLDAVVDETLAVEPVGEVELAEEVDGALLEDAGADAGLDVVARAVLEDDGVDAAAGEGMSEDEAGGAGADDRDLGTHGGSRLILHHAHYQALDGAGRQEQAVD